MKPNKIIKIGNKIVGEGFCIIAGPCAVESEKQLLRTGRAIRKNTDILRAGAFKPRTSPKSFQGMGKRGLDILKKVSKTLKIPVVTEVIDPRDVEIVSDSADMIQIGARNMQNYPLLTEVGRTKKPILLKRGFSSTIEEWLAASDYILKEGNRNVVLCERGIRTFGKSTRFTFDLAGALIAKREGFLVIADPSHATGDPQLIGPLTKASREAGLDGVMIEVHCDPKSAKSDNKQQITPAQFNKIFS